MTNENLLIPALLKAQGQLEHAKKDSTNPHFKSKYADLATVMDTVKPILQANDLVVTHQRESTESGEYLITTIWHKSGQNISSRSKLMPTKADPQGYGSAMTYARRYDLSALIGLASDDDDGNEASKPVKGAKEVYGTHTAMKKKYEEILDLMDGALTHDQLKEVWTKNSVHIKAIGAMDEQFAYDLNQHKEACKAKITEEEANQLSKGM
jgi:hypothetical protein